MTTFLKVQLLFVMILFGVVIYTYFLYNDVIRLEREVVTLKSSVARLEAGNVIKELVCEAPKQSSTPASQPLQHSLTPIPEQDDDFEEDDDSVTSNEIKELLTNINEETVLQPQQDPEPATSNPAPPPASPADLAELSEQELLTYKYEDLRSYLKSKGITCKNGPKIDLVKRILEKAATNQI